MNTQVHEITENTGQGASHDKRQKFIELAEKRTINAIKAIRVIAKLGNKAHYDYDEKDVKKIVSSLNKEVEALKIKMTSSGGQEVIEFKL